MTKLIRRLSRETLEPYRHYKKPIVVTLIADTISLRLKGTCKAYEIPVAHPVNDLCRREANQIAAEKRAKRNGRRKLTFRNLERLFRM